MFHFAASRLHDIVIRVGNTPPVVKKDIQEDAYVICAIREGIIPASATEDILCDPYPVLGRYVVVHKPNTTSPLTLCEVEVYGQPEE